MKKSLALLELVASGHSTLSDLVMRSKMPKSTVHRLTKVLMNHGFLRVDSNQYHLGYRLLEFGELAKQQIRVPTVARQHMEQAARLTNETVHLGELIESDIIYLEKVDGGRGLQMASRVGIKIPAQTTAMGKVLISHLPRLEWRKHFHPLPPKTPNTIVDLRLYLEELQAVRTQGYALDLEENELGIRCVAAPIWDNTGTVVAALSISGAAIYITEERLHELVPEVTTCAQSISRDLGGERYVYVSKAGETAKFGE